jgi:hypothetical protein
MAIDSTVPVRKGVVLALAGDTRVTKIVPASRIFAMTAASPAWPFILYGSPSNIPLRATCLDGGELVVAVHGFAKARQNVAGSTIETAEDHAGRIGAAIAKVLDGRRIDVPGGHAKIAWTGSQLLIDGAEADAFHCVVNLRVRCITR